MVPLAPILGTGAAAAMGLSVGMAGPANAAPASVSNSGDEVPFGLVIVDNPRDLAGDIPAVREPGVPDLPQRRRWPYLVSAEQCAQYQPSRGGVAAAVPV